MRRMPKPRGRALITGLLAVLSAGLAQADDPVRLRYVSRYDHQSGGPDHLMGVESVFGRYALVSSNLALTLVDLESLPAGGTQAYFDRLAGLDAYTTVTRPDGYVYVNLRQGGLAVVYLDPTALTLSLVRRISEPGVFFEKMSVVGDRLYVAAHAYGIRIYDTSDPTAPALLGSLTTGCDDAFAIAVDGTTGYVADGAGGLKIVDLSDETRPRISAGENPATAVGTAEDVLVINNHVYVASGGAGVSVYEAGNLASRTLYDTPKCAKHLARVGNHLAVADMGGLEVFAIQPDGSLLPAARESAMRRRPGSGLSLRLWYGVGAWGPDRVLASDWDSMDVYRLVDPAQDDQPDITVSRQRIRFAPVGGSVVLNVENLGSARLEIPSIRSTQAPFTTQPQSAALQPGESFDLTIEYAGGAPGSALILIDSNDPDENPLPIQVYGETSYLDPGEPAVPFVLPSWTIDHQTGQFTYRDFALQAYAGRIVYFRVFGTW